MTRLAWNSTGHRADLALGPNGLETDHGLDSAVIVSLFTDARARPDDRLPGPPEDRRGWWGDALAGPEDGPIGSRLWLLSREKITAETIARARAYITEALAWLKRDGLAATVEVTVWAEGHALAAQITLTRPDGRAQSFTFADLWEAHRHAL